MPMTYRECCPTSFVSKPVSGSRPNLELPVSDCLGMAVVTPEVRRVPCRTELLPNEATRHCELAAP